MRFVLFSLFFFVSTSSWAQGRLQDFTFNPLQVKRDPFSPPEIKTSELVSDLRQFDLFEMKLVAVMTGLGAPKAMLVLPNGATHIIQEGDALGRNQGVVSQIKSDAVLVRESFKDFRGRTRANVETLSLEKQ
jgi:Tfp pilus assembly protein PilP